jgi:hypothetical protein
MISLLPAPRHRGHYRERRTVAPVHRTRSRSHLAALVLRAAANLTQHKRCKAFALPWCARSLLDMHAGFGLLSIIVAVPLVVAPEQMQAASLTRDLLNACQSLERGKRGTGQVIHIPKTSGALICWGYMEAMQDLSIWVDQSGNRIFGSCPPESTTTLDLIHAFVAYGRLHYREMPKAVPGHIEA